MGEKVQRTAPRNRGPLFYELAAGILQCLEQRRGSIKSLTIGNDNVKPENKRKVYALICQTLKYASVLVPLLKRSRIMETEGIDRRVALLQLHDLLLTKAGLQRNGANTQLNKKISRHAEKLQMELDTIRQDRGVECNEDLVPDYLKDDVSTFRYVRVNLLTTTVDRVVNQFIEEGYKLVDSSRVERNQLHSVLEVKSRSFMRDLDLHDLLVFPPGTDLHAHKLYVNGSVVLQDKASCIPAHVLQPAPGSTALDACAAPGNKTSHMTSLMGNQGKIFAFERNRTRLGTLIKLTSQAKCKIITAQCADFLSIDPLDSEYAEVEYALVDPSCSGSGIVNRMDTLVDSSNVNDETDKARLHNLAKFQTLIILHAMRFPAIKRISYSTCSVHEEENEAVVANVLNSQSEFALASADQVIPTWPRRGLQTTGLTKEQADSLVRSLPEDGTNGFFVAAFVR
ncbi:S-adenosyl-L-methionine-dependent methyltransferase, partial [Coemansia reversa NRRL 1564]